MRSALMSHRDDRTEQALRELVGRENASVALTHFTRGHVEIVVTATALGAPNVLTAFLASANMLSRFVGRVSLWVVGVVDSSVERKLSAHLAFLRTIDCRPGREITVRSVLAMPLREPHCDALARLYFGDDVPIQLGDPDDPSVPSIYLSFDGWRCTVARNGAVGPLVSSSIPFGGLAGACFAVAEVFKILLAGSAGAEYQARFIARQVLRWSFDVWSMERILENEGGGRSLAVGPRELPAVSVDGVLQVGAGAVGNAAALGFRETLALVGMLPVLDGKTVDEKNLNRCYYFTEATIGQPKAQVLEAEASQEQWRIKGVTREFASYDGANRFAILSTVDNNQVRHVMQEALPAYLVQGSTKGTTLAVSVHTAVDGRSCLICRHPDRHSGLARRRPLTVAEASNLTGLDQTVITGGRFGDCTGITDALLEKLRQTSRDIEGAFRRMRSDGLDLCGAIGDLRTRFGVSYAPREASVPFVSVLAGVLASAEVVKLLLMRQGVRGVPVLDNVLVMDLAVNYARNESLAFRELPRADCPLCRGRDELVRRRYAREHAFPPLAR